MSGIDGRSGSGNRYCKANTTASQRSVVVLELSVCVDRRGHSK
jgi:hypothetical protein